MLHIIRSLARKTNSALLAHFAPYIVWDNCGTKKSVWTMRQAMEWLPYCGTHAAIVDTATHRLIVSRQISHAN